MQIAMIGTGYVGLVSAACFARCGNHVTCVDIDRQKIEQLNAGNIPIYEPGLAAVLADRKTRRRLHYTADAAEGCRRADVIFIAVGTPARETDGDADLSQVYAAVKAMAPSLGQHAIVVTKSTVPVGTGEEIEHLIRSIRPGLDFSVASNPEFLRAGHALQDFLQPDRIVIGAEDESPAILLMALYRAVGIDPKRILVTDRRSAELIKYAANGFLATKIAFINEVADLCEKLDARIDDVTNGIGLDRRIGSQFLQPGPGFGGSCFPKDARALARIGDNHRSPMRIIEAALASNETRKQSVVRRIAAVQNNSLRGKTIALLGLTFKAETDDMREAVSIPLAQALIQAGSRVRAYDPVAMDRAKTLLPSEVEYCASAFQAAAEADAIVIATEWSQFRQLDYRALKDTMKTPVIVDLRNLLSERQLQTCGFTYLGIGGPRRKAFEIVPRPPRRNRVAADAASIPAE